MHTEDGPRPTRWRLFVAVWPDATSTEVLAGLPRPARPGLRWTRPEQWHVTLRFIGSARPQEVASALAGAMESAAGAISALAPPVKARLGPATARLGRLVLQVPVAGLDALAALAVSATGGLGQPPREGPFRGHLTLARAQRPLDLRDLVGIPVEASWEPREVTLVSSRPGQAGPGRYEVIGRWRLG